MERKTSMSEEDKKNTVPRRYAAFDRRPVLYWTPVEAAPRFALVACLAVICLTLFLLSCGGDDEESLTSTPATGDVEVELYDNFFEYREQKQPNIPVRAGANIKVELKNEGSAIHNMINKKGG
jgi:hypothetical protein